MPGFEKTSRDDNHKERSFFLNWPAIIAHLYKWSSSLVRSQIMYWPDLKEKGPVIFAHWHSDDLPMMPYFGHLDDKMNILISSSRDGDILSRAVSSLGYGVCRGSSSKDALRGLIALKRGLTEGGRSVIMAADGPRGPRKVAKPGAVFLAAKTGRPIYPIAVACSRAYIFKDSWNKAQVPLPGSKILVYVGQPLLFPPEAAKWPSHVKSRILGAAITDATRSAQLELTRKADQTAS